jgi:hypothetical protein
MEAGWALLAQGAASAQAHAKPTGDDYGNTFATATTLSLNSSGAASAAGKIDSSTDVDMLKITATVTGAMTVNLNVGGGKSKVDPYLVVYSAAQTKLAENNNSSASTKNASVSLSVTAGSVYYIQATGNAGATGAWSLAITTAAPPPPPPPSPTPPAFMPGADAYAAGAAVSGQVIATSAGPVVVVLGTDGADSLSLSASGNMFSVSFAGATLSYTDASTIVGVAVYGFGGGDTLRMDYTLPAGLYTVVYAGAGADAIYSAGNDRAYLYGQADNDKLVTIGGGSDVLYGGTGLDSLWLDSADTLADGESTETAGKSIHRVTAFAQPTTDPAKAVSLEIAGQDIVDPAASYAYTNDFISRPLFVDGAQYNDIRQGAVGDCYFMAALSALAQSDSWVIDQSITALGDGTYAVRFYSGATEYYYRVDAQLPTSSGNPAYAKLTRTTGELWVALVEKAFAQFRNGTNSYASIDTGPIEEGFRAMTGATTSSWSTNGQAANTLAQQLANQIAAGHAVGAISSGNINPIVGSHAYNVHASEFDAATATWYVTVYNPWGDDGRTWDSNYGDGLLRLTAAEFAARFQWIATSVV